jgi:RHS repeat-associated protein
MTYSYDRRGRQTGIVTGTNAVVLAYNDATQLLMESNSAGTLAGLAVTNGYDQFLRRTNVVTLSPQLAVLNWTSYGYDTESRLLVVSNDDNSATYGYLANSPLVGQIQFKQGSTLRMTTTKNYDSLNRLTSISSVPTASSTVEYDYAYNAANQRTRTTLGDSTYWSYQYDSLGQVISGKKYWSDGTPVAGQQFEYRFDDTGNRRTAGVGGDQFGVNLRHATYTANGLNQYINRTVPGYVNVVGEATNTATVTVNNQPTYRRGNYFRGEVALTNTPTACWASLTSQAVLNNGNDLDIIATNTGSVFMPPTSEHFTYDADGNLIQDGRWNYVWDAENRLKEIHSRALLPSPPRWIEFQYDVRGRRIRETVWNAVDEGKGIELWDRLYLYDGWNLTAELDPNASNTRVRTYMWGLDLSGAEQGAGGVGGLLKVAYYGTQTNNCFAIFDGNGNIAGLVNAADGAAVAQYEYGPFGEVIRATGPMAKANPFRFSTKYQDDESDLVYYGYRYYNASTGRWPNSDPLGEKGGKNLYAFVLNDPVRFHDSKGLCPCCACVVDVHIANVHKFADGNLYGHRFDVAIMLRYKYTSSLKEGDAQLLWEEKSDNPPDWQGLTPNRWNEVFALFPTSPTFNPWNFKERKCPGWVSLTITDRPAEFLGNSRVLNFRITVKSAPNCNCTDKSKTVTATQTLASSGNNITEWEFTSP